LKTVLEQNLITADYSSKITTLIAFKGREEEELGRCEFDLAQYYESEHPNVSLPLAGCKDPKAKLELILRFKTLNENDETPKSQMTPNARRSSTKRRGT